MIRESETFTFDNIKSEDYNIYNVLVTQNSSNGGVSEPFTSNTTLHKISVPRISKNYLQFTEKAPIQFTLEFYLDDVWNSENIDKIKRWLFQDTYREMTFSQEEYKIYDVIAIGDVTLTHDSNGHGSILIQFECKDYYSYSATIGSDIDYDFSNGSGTVSISNLGSLTTYPEIWLQKIGNGSLSIINHSDNDNKLEFYPASKATGILTCNGTVYDGELIQISDNVFEIDTGDGEIGTHQEILGQPAVNNIKVSIPANFAYGILRWQDGQVQDGETITIGYDTYEFDTDGIYSKNDIPVDISKYCTTAKFKFDLDSNSPSSKFTIFTKTVCIQNIQYNFEQGTDTQIMKVDHKLDANIDTSGYRYRVINVCEYPEFQKYADPNNLANGYVDRTIFHNMKPIEILDSMHLAIINMDYQLKEGVSKYFTDPNQAPYSDINKQEINIYTYDSCGVQLVAWQNDGSILYVPDNSIPSMAHAGSVLELESHDIVDATGTIVYTGRKFYVGIKNIQTGLSWNGVAISKVYLMSSGNGLLGADYPQIENDLPVDAQTNSPLDLWYTDSADNGTIYPSDYHFPCNRWETSKTQKANTIITAVINHVDTGNNPNTDTHSLPLLGADLSKSNTILCGATMHETMQNFADAINASATIAGSEYSTDITTANKYVSAQKMEMDNTAYGNTIPYVLLTSKLAGIEGNNIEVKFTNNVTGNVDKEHLDGGSNCTSADAQRELIRAIAKNYQLNPSFTANVDRYYPVYLVNGIETRVSVDNNGLLPNESEGAWSTLGSWIKIRAMIAGSRGNNILVASNTSVCSWGQNPTGDIIISFINGSDPSDISVILNVIATEINTNGNGYSASVINSNQIQITYNTTGQQGNVPVSTTCFNISFDSYRLNGGLDELQNLEMIYINCNEGDEHIESSLQIPRYDNCNLNFLKLIYGNNDLEIQGACKIRFLYQYRYR